jgi:hypothetical protein
VKKPGSTNSRPAIISDTLLIISAAGLSPAAIFVASVKVLKSLITNQRHTDNRRKNNQNQRHQDAHHMGNLNKNRYLYVNIEKNGK